MKPNWQGRGTLNVCYVAAMLVASTVFAPAITFNLRDTTATVEIESGVITRGGVKATLTPIVSGSSGPLNQSGDSFGVNASGTGDDLDGLDGALGIESVSIVFDTVVLFTGIQFSLFSAGETASLTIGGFSPQSLADTGATPDAFNFATDNLVSIGQTVVLRWGSGNGFSFDSFTVDLPPTSGSSPVSDGSKSISLALLAFGATALARRRLNASGGPRLNGAGNG